MDGGTVSFPHVEKAEAFARGVLDFSIPACKWVRLAAKRHFDDRRRSIGRDFPYKFDEELAEFGICEFAELLPHTKGRWAQRKERFKLGPWQCFILCMLFGWVKKSDGLRRFLEALLVIPRKNGKSPMAAIIGLFLWAMDGEAGAEVYSGATTEAQAWEVFRPAKIMLEKSPDFIQEVGAQPYVSKLVIPEDNSVFEPIIGNPGDGSAPNCAIIDEWHEHDSTAQVDTMRTGMVGREQPLLLKITTAGTNLAGPCYDDVKHAEKVLEGTVEDERLFAIIFTIDLEEYVD